MKKLMVDSGFSCRVVLGRGCLCALAGWLLQAGCVESSRSRGEELDLAGTVTADLSATHRDIKEINDLAVDRGDREPDAAGDAAGPGDLAEELDLAEITEDLGPCAQSGVERCDGLDNDCNGAIDEADPAGLGQTCSVAGVVGQLACVEQQLVCRANAAGGALCGVAAGVLSASQEPLRFACPVVVPREAELVLESGAILEPGRFSLRVEGRLRAGAATLREVESVAIEVANGGEVRLDGTSIIVRQGDGQPLIRLRSLGQALLNEVRLRDALGRSVGVAVEGEANPLIRNSTLAGLWIGVRARDRTRPQIEGSRFLACTTGVMADEQASPIIRQSAFSGEGFHLWLAPEALAGPAPWLPTNSFEGGTAITLAGAVESDVRLAPLAAMNEVALFGVRIAPGGILRLAPGLRVLLTGEPLEVEGWLDAAGVVFPELTGTALQFAPGSGGQLAECTFEAIDVPGLPLVLLEEAEVVLEDCSFADPTGRSVGVVIAGEAPDRHPSLTGNRFVGLWTGIRVEAESGPVLGGNEFSACRVGMAAQGRGAATQVQDNRFVGDGLHLLLTPSFFAGNPGPDCFQSNQFDPAGIAMLVSGEVQGETALWPVQNLPLRLGSVQVKPGAALSFQAGPVPDPRLEQVEGQLLVEGHLELRDLLLQVARSTAIEFRAGASGLLERMTLLFEGNEAVPLVRIIDSSPSFRAVTFAGGGTAATGLHVIQTPSPEPAGPLVQGCLFRDLAVGILISGAAVPTLEQNEFGPGVLPVCPGTEGCP